MKIKRFLFISVGSLIVIFILLTSLLYFNRDKIALMVEQKINSNLNAHFAFSKAGLSFRHFPSIGIRLIDVSITGVETFAGDTLFHGESLDIAINPFSLLKKKEGINIRFIHLQRPDLRILILPDGAANYQIFKESEPETETQTNGNDLMVRLHSYSIRDGNILYDDRSQRNHATITNLDQKGHGDFSAKQFVLATVTDVESCSYFRNSIPMLKDVAIKLDNKINVDLDQNKYELDETKLVLNDLYIALRGFAAWNEDAVSYHVSFETPQNDFKELISLIPGVYKENFSSLEASGQFSLSGNVTSTDTMSYPAFEVALSVSGGTLHHPEKGVRFRDIHIKGNVDNPGSDADGTLIDLPQISWVLNDRPFNGSFLLKTPYSDPDLQAVMKGSVDLADIHKAFMESSSHQLAGIIDVDISSNAKWSDIDRQAYDRVTMGGELIIQDLKYEQSDYPAFRINAGKIQLNPRHWSLQNMTGSYGRSDFNIDGNLENILSVVSGSKPINGSFTFESKLVDLNEWMPEDEGSATGFNDTLYAVPEFYNRLNLNASVRAGTILYSDYVFTDASTNGILKGQELTFENASCMFEEGRLTGRGNMQGLWDYMFRGTALSGDMVIHSDKLDLNQLMKADDPGQTGTSQEDPAEMTIIPVNLDLQIRYSSDEVTFQRAVCNRVTGSLRIHQGVADLENMRCDLFGGQVLLNGSYSTLNPAEPTFSLAYEVNDLDFQQTFKTFNTYSKLAPIGQFINGKFNSNLSMKAKLKPDLTPVITSITADGFLETYNAIIGNFPPLEAVSNLLQMDFLKNWNIRNTRNWFEVSEGVVSVRPFDISYQGVEMTISGKHTLEQEMDYRLLMQVPYQRLSAKIKPGESLGHLASQAAKLGIQLNDNVQISLMVKLKGTIKNPVVEVELVDNIKTLVVEQVKEKIDSIRNELIEELNEKKSEITADFRAEVSAIRDRAKVQVDQIMSEASRLSEEIRQEGYARADQLVAAAGHDPIRKFAAQKAADKLRMETDKKVDKILSDAELRAKKILERSESRVDSIIGTSSE